MNVALLSPARGTGNIGDHIIEAAVRRLLGPDVTCHAFSVRRPLTTRAIDAINRTSAALVCGTNLYQHEWEPAFDEDVLAQITVPVVPFGVGGSARDLDAVEIGDATCRMIRALHQRCQLGGVRDPHALEVVRRAGVRNVTLTGCPVLFWGDAPRLEPPRPRRRSRVILTARNWLMHHWPDNVDHPVQLAFLRQVLEALRDEDVTFAIHEELDERLVASLRFPPERVVRSLDVEQYLRLYADPEAVVVAMRLHAGMLALANGVPAVFVGHDTRTYSFCSMIGLPYIRLFEADASTRCSERTRAYLAGDMTDFRGVPAAFAPLAEEMRRFLSVNSLRQPPSAA